MNLKEYIKNLNEFLINEEFEEGTSETMNDKVTALQDLLKRFQEFLQKIEGKTTLEEIQAAAGGENTKQSAPAQPQQSSAPPQASQENPQEGNTESSQN